VGHTCPHLPIHGTKVPLRPAQSRYEVRSIARFPLLLSPPSHLELRRAPQSFFATDSGSILNRFSQDMTLIEGQLATGVLVTVSSTFNSASFFLIFHERVCLADKL